MDTSTAPTYKLENLPAAEVSSGLGLKMASAGALLCALAAVWLAVMVSPLIAKGAYAFGAVVLAVAAWLLWSYVSTSRAADIPVSQYHDSPSKDA